MSKNEWRKLKFRIQVFFPSLLSIPTFRKSFWVTPLQISQWVSFVTLAEGFDTTVIGALKDPVTWYRINYTGTQMTQWDFQNKGILTSPARLSFVLKVPVRHLRPSVIYSVPCDQILQRAYLSACKVMHILMTRVWNKIDKWTSGNIVFVCLYCLQKASCCCCCRWWSF